MKYRIALVEYLNTLPFSLGIKHLQLDDRFEVCAVTPAQCARLFEQGDVDISLCPVGALDEMPPHEIRGNFCIGADGAVGTVKLLSKVPLEQITKVRLDDHSRTSNLLLQILAAQWWKKEWEFYTDADPTMPETCLMIGDKVFANAGHYPYHFDLAAAWKELTGKPMVFAVWIARPGIPNDAMHLLDDAFKSGMAFIKSGQSDLADWQIAYLLHNISYPLDNEKMEAMHLFFKWAKAIASEPASDILNSL
jgi:chorismate dehydratase